MTSDFATYFARIAAKVDPSAPSTTKWNPVRDLVAEELGRDPSEVYVATISKPGNTTVRFGQSDAAHSSPILLAMHTDKPGTLEKTIASMRRIAAARDATAAVGSGAEGGWRVVAVLAKEGDPAASPLMDAFPGAVLLAP